MLGVRSKPAYASAMSLKLALTTLSMVVLCGCAGFLQTLNRHGLDVANAVLSCVPAAAQPSASSAAACFDSALGILSPDTSEAHGEQVLTCASAIRTAQETGDPDDESRASELVGQLSN